MKLNHKLELMDQFDDAAFALMMDEYAEAEGERLRAEFEEAMRSGTAPACPPELDEKCRKQIKRHFGKQRRSAYAGIARRAAGRAAACLLIALGISAALVMSVEAIREPFWKFIENQYSDQTVFDLGQINENKEIDGDDFNQFDLDDPIVFYLPEGYRSVDFNIDKGRISSRYEGDDGKYIRVHMWFSQDDGGEPWFDEKYDKYVDINGKEVVLSVDREDSQLRSIDWFVPEIETRFSISAREIDEMEFVNFCRMVNNCFSDSTIDKQSVVPDALEGKLPETYQQVLSRTLDGYFSCVYVDGEKSILFNVYEMEGLLATYVEEPVVTECTIAGYEAKVMNGTNKIETIIADEARELIYTCITFGLTEEDHLSLCEYLAEYYKDVTLPMVSTVIWE